MFECSEAVGRIHFSTDTRGRHRTRFWKLIFGCDRVFPKYFNDKGVGMFRFGCSLLILSLAAAIAQESRGTIGGRVADAQDSGIPAAKVIITNVDTGVATTLDTNDKGAYVAPLLIPGNYRITAEHPGFKRAAQTGITLSINDTLQVDLRLELGDVSQSVDVVATAPLVQSADASMGVVITNKELSDFPIAHGNPYAMIALAPGVTFEGDQTLNRPYEPTHIVDYSMSGTLSGTTDITLEGVSNTSKGSNGRVA